jgi:hypothetical protein
MDGDVTGRRISRAAHRMSGDVFVLRPVPSTVKLSDTEMVEATKRDAQEIEQLKQDLQPTDHQARQADGD